MVEVVGQEVVAAEPGAAVVSGQAQALAVAPTEGLPGSAAPVAMVPEVSEAMVSEASEAATVSEVAMATAATVMQASAVVAMAAMAEVGAAMAEAGATVAGD